MNLKHLAATAALTALIVGGGASVAGATSTTTVVGTVRQLSQHMSEGSDAAKAGDTAALSTACSEMGDDASTFLTYSKPRGYPRAAWRLARSGMRHLMTAAPACVYGADNYDTASLQLAASEMQTGGGLISRAAALAS